jgi:HK97 family phage prohead protease
MTAPRGPVRRGNAPEVRLYERALTLVDTDTTDSLSFLEGRAVPYGQMTDTGWWYLEEMDAGLFNASTDAHPDLPLLLFHNGRSFPIGVADEWRDANDGLHGIWRLDRDSPEAQRAARQARDGFLTGMSVGFAPIKSEWTYADWEAWDPEDPATYDQVHRQEARLLETSLTPTPAYADAQVALVRSVEGRRAGPGRAGAGRGVRTRHTALNRAAALPAARSDTPGTPYLDYWRERLRTL